MSQINRKYNFQDETSTIANQLDEEFGQLVEAYNTQELIISDHINKTVNPDSNDATKDKHVSNLDIKLINDQMNNVVSGGLDLRYYTKPEIDAMALTGQVNSSSSSIYVLDLTTWSVNNNGTDAVNTTKGINDAMVWAVLNGYKEMLLPKGTYLIDETSPIEPQSNFTLNLNGSSLKIRSNDQSEYSVINFQKNQVHSRITNGKIIGDREVHDYSSGGSHEAGYGIQVGSFSPPDSGGSNARNIILDNLDIYNFTGDSVALCSAFGQISPFPTSLASSWEQGDIDPSNGNLLASTSKIRSTLKFSMTQLPIVNYSYFGLYGNGYGDLGKDIICDFYNVIFYKADNSFHSSKTLVQFFDEVEVPLNVSYAKVVLHQSTVPASANCSINVRVPTFPQYVYIEKCNLHHNRRLGISICGAKNVYIEENAIHHIGGTSNTTGTDPQGGIDIEDGYDLNQFIHIHKNSFHDNEKYNIIAVNGKCIYISNNTLLKTNQDGYVSLAINGGVDRAIISSNTIRNGKVGIGGECQFINNHIYGTQVDASAVYATRPINFSSNTFYNCKLLLDTPFPYLVNIDNCRFINNIDKLNSLSNQYQWTIEYKNQPQKFTNCIFEGADSLYFSSIPTTTTKQYWLFENCLFKGIGLPSLGRLVNCIGDGSSTSNAYSSSTGLTSDSLEMYNCRFISTDSNNTLFTINNLKSFRMENCYIEKTSGWLLRLQNIGTDVVIKNNTFKITNDTLSRNIITLESSFTGNQILISNNQILSTNNSQVGIDNQTTNKPQIVIADNVMKKATIKFNGTEVLMSNVIDGIVDPYYKITSEPNTFYYTKGQLLYNANPTSGGFLGWVCTTAGTANKNVWAQLTNYSLNTLVSSNSKVYKCTVAGKSGSTPPSHSTGTASDGTVVWQYVDVLAVFKQFGAIS